MGAHVPTFSSRIDEELRRRNWSQGDLARAVGVSQQTVSRWLLGRSSPAGIHLRQLALILGTTTDEILALVNVQQPELAPDGIPG